MQILLVDDNLQESEQIRASICGAATSCRVHGARSLAQSMDALAQKAFDAVLLDLELPDGDGVTGLSRIREAAPRTPIIVLVDNGCIDLVRQASAGGAAGVVFKAPIDSTRLVRTLTFAAARYEQTRSLRHSEEKFHNIVENMNDAYYEVDFTGKTLYANKYLREQSLREKEMVGAEYTSFTASQDRDHLIQIFMEVLQTRKPVNRAIWNYLDPGGTRHYIESSVALIYTENGEPVAFNGISRNVTTQVTTKNALQASMERYQTILESIEDTYLEIDLQGRICFFNRASKGMYGYSADELLRMDYWQYMDADNTRKLTEAFSHIYKTGESNNSLQFDVIQKNGDIMHIEASMALMHDEDGRPVGFRGVGRNITERKAKERELIQAKEKAEAATLAKSEFLASMSHEIRTPMNGIMGMYSLLQNTSLDGDQCDFVNTGKGCAEALLTLINDILDYSKIEAGKLELESIDFDLRMTIEDMILLPAAKAQGKGLEFVYHIDPDVPSRLMGDPGRLRQVVFNLMVNAVKFTREGEVGLWVSLEKADADAATIRFTIKDTGIGISRAEQGRLFQSFQQVDASSTRKYGGAGLGLVIVRRLTELMGGQIGIKSALGRGSTFWLSFSFPKAEAYAEQHLPAPDALSGKRILIVDDNQTNLDILEHHLTRWGCDCDRAGSAAMALMLMNATAKAGAPYELVLTDMMMPEMDGAELGRRIKAEPRLKDCLLVMLTSMGMRGDGVEMKRIGFAAYLTKPVRPSQLYECLLTILCRDPKHCMDAPAPQLVTCHALNDARRSAWRILLAEDNAVNQKLALHLLNRFGFETDAVTTGKAALAALAATAYDLVLMDVEMPEMNGLEAAAAIRDPSSEVLNHAIPIVAMTARAEAKDQKECLAAGMDAYISKPIQPHELKQVIEARLQNRV